jgi:ankyrin repeat protein
VLLPVKLVHHGTTNARGAIMTIVLALSLPIEKAKEVVKLLIKLGATSAQADMYHFTALHYIVADDNSDILDVLLAHDRPVALGVLNNVGFHAWDNNISSPVTTAVEKGYQEMVSKLLSLGAIPTITFDDWIKAYLAKNKSAKNQSPEDNLNEYRTSVVQPIVAAAVKEMGKTVEKLLAQGADANTLEKTAYSILQHPHYSVYKVAESLLDIIQKKLKALREYKEPDQNVQKPETLRDEYSYTSGLTEGTYKHWSALSDYRTKKLANKKEFEKYEEVLKSWSQGGVTEKKEAISKLIQELEKAEKALIAAGAEPFYKMHPEFQKKKADGRHVFERVRPKPYETSFLFQVPDLNDMKKDGYLKLFEAAWSNDLETIKSMTLGTWAWLSEKPTNTPLKIAVKDRNGFSPFSIAVLRGHRDLARKIVEICLTQYHMNDGVSNRQRWTIRGSDSDDDDDSDNGEDLPIYSELVSDKFTVDNLGEVSNIVKSDVLPLTMIEWPCMPQRFFDSDKKTIEGQSTMLEHAVEIDNMELFKFIIELGGEQQALLAEQDDDQKCYAIDRTVFYNAIRLGRTVMLAEMIKLTGVGIPLNELIKKSGIELKTKPRYYQGLTVGGKKRADWAKAPGSGGQVFEEKVPPLLQAAHVGSIESVEWFMSDAPRRRYKEFAENNKNDKRIKALQHSGKGFDKTIGTWLDAKSEILRFKWSE